MTSIPNNTKNLISESDGTDYLLKFNKNLIKPTLEQKKQLLELVNVPNIYIRSFDLVRLKVPNFDSIITKNDFELIELKVTRKYLKNFPKGFFFGMTQNEDNLLKDLDGVFFICLVSINEIATSHIFLSHSGLHSLIKNKRIQYQITL